MAIDHVRDIADPAAIRWLVEKKQEAIAEQVDVVADLNRLISRLEELN